MYAVTKRVEVPSLDKEIICMDLTYGYMVQVANGEVVETTMAVVVNGTELDEDDVNKLRRSEVQGLYDAIIRLSYPHLFNDDGTPKELPEEVETEEDKKKV